MNPHRLFSNSQPLPGLLATALTSLLLGCDLLGGGTAVAGPALADDAGQIAATSTGADTADQGRSARNADTTGGQGSGHGEPRQSTPAPFVVHEWGTFTSMQTSEGKTLDGMHHEDEPLPSFVHSRLFGSENSKGVEMLPEPVTQKMETPILYFHSDIARDVTVRVDFPKGVISQWYPRAEFWAPGNYEMKGMRDGSMTWKVRVDPELDRDAIPKVDKDDIWAPSREVDVPALTAGDERERFIFYRGLGRFELPLRVTSDKALHLRNDGAIAIPAAYLLITDAKGGSVVSLGALAPGQVLDVPVPVAVPGIPAFLQAARAALTTGLLASGLTDQETAAMVNTWTRSWFQTPGLRVLYVLPRAWTDELLPIDIAPKPDQLVRTLVGRIEVLTPAIEAEIVQAVKAVHDGGSYDQLSELGRFLEPKILRAQQLLQGTPAAKTCLQILDWTDKHP